ncbi:MAG: 1-acyl-sn-glycerol-3-phosphate acyltransferase [Bacteroidota bacterium]
MQKEHERFIDVEQVIANKNPQLLRWLPGFVLRYIKRIVHEEHINTFIRHHGHKQSFEFIDAIIEDFGVRIISNGIDHIPASGGCIIAANHPIGGLDAMALMQAVALRRKYQSFIVNDVLMNLKNLNELFVGVNKHGKNTQDALAEIDRLYAGTGAVLIFPAGLVSRKQRGEIIDLEWKKSFITKAKRFSKPIIPVHITGRNSDFFYNLARWRSRLGIRSNIEMLYLMDEMFHQRGKDITLTFGAPLEPARFNNSRSDREWAFRVKEHVYSLEPGKNPTDPFAP